MPVTRVVAGQFSLGVWRYVLDPTSVAELSSFATITVDSGGADPLEAEAQIVLRLEGAGGKLNFTSRTGGAHSVHVEDIGLTSKVALTGTVNDDILDGSAFADTLNGRAGADAMTGGAGNDTYYVDDAGDTVMESTGGGIDTVRTTLSSYSLGTEVDRVLFAGSGNFEGTGNGLANVLTGGAGNDTLSGEDGNDKLNGRTGADGMTGGAGNDTYYVDDDGDTVTESTGGGIDTVRTTLSSYSLGTEVDRVLFTGLGNFVGTGNELANVLTGGAGNDTLSGHDGNDRLNGGTGADGMTGGSGNDTYYVDDDGDAVMENVGGGIDTVRTTLSSYTLGAEVERLAFIGSGDFVGTGNALANVLTGGAGNDSLDGGLGDDTIMGAQNDTLLDGGADTDTLRVTAAFSSTGDDQITNLEKVLLTQAVTLDLSKQTEGFAITGSAGIDSITGGSGADSISAGAGNDTIMGAQNDTLLNGGADTDTLQVGADFTSTGDGQIASIENVLLTSAARLIFANQTEGFTITGSSGVDFLAGGSGNDTIEGGAANDVLNGNLGIDTVSYASTTAGGVTVNLTSGMAQSGDGRDTLINFENITGSAFNDILTGNIVRNVMEGGAGDDLLNGAGGADTASYASATAGVVVNLAITTAQDTGGAGNDTLMNMEDLTGSSFNDILTGNSGDNVIQGGAGNDTFVYAGGPSGIDRITDFTHAADLLDFQSISSGQSMATLVSEGVISWVEDGGITIISVDLDGSAGPGEATIAFVLAGVGLGLDQHDFIV